SGGGVPAHRAAHSCGGHPRWSIIPTPRPPVFDLDVMVLDVAGFVQALPKRRQCARLRLDRTAIHETNYRHHRLLRARRERPRGSRAAEQRYERAPLHSITSSARSRNDSGIINPMAFAALRLTTNWNFVG